MHHKFLHAHSTKFSKSYKITCNLVKIWKQHESLIFLIWEDTADSREFGKYYKCYKNIYNGSIYNI